MAALGGWDVSYERGTPAPVVCDKPPRGSRHAWLACPHRLQGHLAHKEPPTPLGPPLEPRHGPTGWRFLVRKVPLYTHDFWAAWFKQIYVNRRAWMRKQSALVGTALSVGGARGAWGGGATEVDDRPEFFFFIFKPRVRKKSLGPSEVASPPPFLLPLPVAIPLRLSLPPPLPPSDRPTSGEERALEGCLAHKNPPPPRTLR